MTLLLDGPLIDLVEFGRYEKLACGRRFATPIALLATGVVSRYMDERELVGIQTCLRYQLRTLAWKDFTFGIPLGRHSLNYGSFDYSDSGDRTYMLPNSLIASVLRYRDALNENGTGLRSIIFSNLLNGLEWACWRSLRESELEKADGTKLFSKSELNSYIAWESN